MSPDEDTSLIISHFKTDGEDEKKRSEMTLKDSSLRCKRQKQKNTGRNLNGYGEIDVKRLRRTKAIFQPLTVSKKPQLTMNGIRVSFPGTHLKLTEVSRPSGWTSLVETRRSIEPSENMNLIESPVLTCSGSRLAVTGQASSSGRTVFSCASRLAMAQNDKEMNISSFLGLPALLWECIVVAIWQFLLGQQKGSIGQGSGASMVAGRVDQSACVTTA